MPPKQSQPAGVATLHDDVLMIVKLTTIISTASQSWTPHSPGKYQVLPPPVSFAKWDSALFWCADLERWLNASIIEVKKK